MATRLSDSIVKALALPEKGSRIEYDTEVKGFGCRITAGGARSFILNYRTRNRRERRYTIGNFPDWRTAGARQEAKELKRQIDAGGDPLGSLQAERGELTMADLAQRFEEEHLPKLAATTAAAYRRNLSYFILPDLRNVKVSAVTLADIEDVHRKVTRGHIRRVVNGRERVIRGGAFQANRVLALLGKMFTLAVRWGLRPDNPVKGADKNREEGRERYLREGELPALTAALAADEDQGAANIVRLLLLSGARRGEVLRMRWQDLDLEAGAWTKPSHHTKTRKVHRVPLSAPARQLLANLAAARDPNTEYVFPGGRGSERRADIKKAWHRITSAAGIEGLRLHDLRHNYASVLVSSGLSLPVIGALLGHTQPRTTSRYAHLFDDPLRAATEHVGALFERSGSSDVTQLVRGTR